MVVFALVTHHVRCTPALCLHVVLSVSVLDTSEHGGIDVASVTSVDGLLSQRDPASLADVSQTCNMLFCRRTGELAAAVTWLRWALGERGHDAELQSRLGLVHLLTGDTRAAAAAFRQAAAWLTVRSCCFRWSRVTNCGAQHICCKGSCSA